MKVALIVIGRLENRYAPEFVEYYKQLGVDTIFIIDNNKDGEEHFEDVLQQYINENLVHIINYRNVNTGYSFQVNKYINTYKKYKDKYDWFIFLDFDEYLTLKEDKTIQEYLSRDCFKDFNQILINWKIYTDNDLLYDDGRPCLERFTTPMDILKFVEYKDKPENMHVKCIIRGNLTDINMKIPHYVSGELINITTCDNKGDKIQEKHVDAFQTINYKLAYIKHFTTKTLDEWITNKFKKGVGDRNYDSFLSTYPIERFFKYNNITPEKIQYLKDKGIKLDLDKVINWYIN